MRVRTQILEIGVQVGQTEGLATTPDAAWGASLRLAANFSQRWGVVSSARQLIAELCAEYLQPTDRSAALVMAAQELLENLAKYSLDDSATFEFELKMRDGQPEVRICSSNAASQQHVTQAAELLERIVTCTDPVALYDEWVAASGEREGSRLGLIRLRAEAGLSLSYSIDSARLSVEVTGLVEPKVSSK